MKHYAGVLALLWGLLGAHLAAAFTPPSGCRGVMSVQYSGCMVAHVWRCQADPEGVQWIGVFDLQGQMFMRKVDKEFRWLETFFFSPPATQLMQSSSENPPNLSDLLETGEDSYDFTVATGDVITRYRGADRLTGERSIVDGLLLHRVEFNYERINEDGEVLNAQSGMQYVSEELRMFFWEASWDTQKPAIVYENAPVSFEFPQDPDFMKDEPHYGCDYVLSQLRNE